MGNTQETGMEVQINKESVNAATANLTQNNQNMMCTKDHLVPAKKRRVSIKKEFDSKADHNS